MSKKVYICDCDHDNIDVEKSVFDKAGIECEWHHCVEQDKVIEECQGAEVFLNQYAKMDKVIFEAIPTLKCVIRYGVGVDNVNLKDATEYGVQVCNVPDYGMNEVADQALAMMLALVRKVCFVNDRIRNGVWDYTETIPIRRNGCITVGVIGVGRIGCEFAKRVKALGCRVIGYDIAFQDNKRQFPDWIERVSFETLLKESDVISIHCSLNEKSRNLIDAQALELMKPSAYLINVARGGIIDEEALDEALTKGTIAGAALDVVKNEHLDKDDALLKHKNFIVSPHMAWYSEEAAFELNRKAAEEAVRFLNGEKVLYPVNQL